MRRTTKLLLTTVLFAAVGCSISELEDLDLSGDITASPLTATVGQEVSFTIEAQGTRLLSFLVDYGDGTEPNFLSIAGSREARWTSVHTFEQAGTFEVVGRIDEISDTLSRTVVVTITAPAARPGSDLTPFVEARRDD